MSNKDLDCQAPSTIHTIESEVSFDSFLISSICESILSCDKIILLVSGDDSEYYFWQRIVRKLRKPGPTWWMMDRCGKAAKIMSPKPASLKICSDNCEGSMSLHFL